jgi:transcriptional regulator with XRE-family HTH domain
MGRSRRPKPAYLAPKLKQIRLSLGLSQTEMLERLNYKHSSLVASQISEFENDKREPPVLVLLSYARAAGVPLEILVDDELKLPEKLPCRPAQWVFKTKSG